MKTFGGYLASSQDHDFPSGIPSKKAQGSWVQDVDGNLFLDFTAGIAVCSTGHCHPKVVEAIKEQADCLLHMSGSDFSYPSLIKLAEKLAKLAPGSVGKKVYFGNSGSEAVEAAFKLARWHTQRDLNIAFLGAFHGRTMGALSLTASKLVQKKHYNPLVPGVTHIPFPNCYRCPWGMCAPECGMSCVDFVEDTLFRTSVPPEEVAAIIVDPIQGEGGYIIPPSNFHQEMYRIAKKYEILYVVDEVQSGMGRTGKMFAIEHFGVEPDIIALAKGVASRMPLGAVVAKADIMDWEAGSHGSTFGGNPVSCKAALATIELLEDHLMANAVKHGTRLLEGLKKLQNSHECIGDARGIGLMAALMLVKDRKTKEPDKVLRKKLTVVSLYFRMYFRRPRKKKFKSLHCFRPLTGPSVQG